MASFLSLRRLAVASLVSLSSAVHAQDDNATVLQTCLTDAGVRAVVASDDSWATETVQFQKRLTPDPAAIAFPETKDQVALSLDCARNSSVKASALGPAHSFQGYGFGDAGNLIINMAAFDEASYDADTTYLTFGGGSHVGPVVKHLWDTAGRHIPHVRGAHVGVVGSSIGGGYGSTSRHFGTPMDNLVSVEYMLYNGTIVNAAKGSDLFWAAQGAGASYGIILSMTTATHVPEFDRAINFTLSLGNVSTDAAAEGLIAIQDFATSDACPDEFAIRFTLGGAPYNNIGYFYGDPDTFDDVVAPLVESLQAISGQVELKKTVLPFWDLEVSVGGAGMNQANGGSLGGRAMHVQSFTTTTDNPLTIEQAKTLLNSVVSSPNRPDMRRTGFLDLWGGVSRDISDSDTAYAHGKNLWLIRVDGVSVDPVAFPADGLDYMRTITAPFAKALVDGGTPLRGFVNYADSELTEEEWSSRLYGDNYNKLKQIKKDVDPEGLFTNHRQSIPSP